MRGDQVETKTGVANRLIHSVRCAPTSSNVTGRAAYRHAQQFAHLCRGNLAVLAKTIAPAAFRMITEVHPWPIFLVGKRAARRDETVGSPMAVQLLKYSLSYRVNGCL